MLVMIIINKMRSFLLFFVTLFRRALCCFRRRRRLSNVEPLTDIGIVANTQTIVEPDNWNTWGDDGFQNKKPNTVQEHIEYYRQQKAHIQNQEESPEENANYFEDMTPRITSQRKVFISTDEGRNEQSNSLSLAPDVVLTGNELGEWEENSGWGGEKLEWEAMEVLKEQKRLERERKAYEQQQRRIERTTKSQTSNVRINA